MTKKKNYKKINIFLVLTTSAFLFFLTKPTLVDALIEEQSTVFEIEVTADENNFSQIIKRDQNGKVDFLTNEQTTHANPDYNSQSVVWMAQVNENWQIFLYDVSADTTLQLTNTGNNVNPKIFNQTIVWEGQVKGIWQIFMFDGLKVSQITSGNNPKKEADLNDQVISYTQKEGDTWFIYTFDYKNKISEKIADQPGKNAQIKEGKITWLSSTPTQTDTYEYEIKTKKLTKIKTVAYTELNEIKEEEKINEEENEADKIREEEVNESPSEPEPKETVTTEDIIEELDLPADLVEETPESTPTVIPATPETTSSQP